MKTGKKDRTKPVQREPKDEPIHIKLDFKPDKNQNKYCEALRTKRFIMCNAKAGTGKTTIAVYQLILDLLNGTIKRVVYCRLVDDRYLKQGYHAGTLEEKESGLYKPFYDAAYEIGLKKAQIEKLIKEEKIILTTDTTLRGTNLKETGLIIDESQNAKTCGDLQLILTRVHDFGGKVVVIGHTGQCDNKNVEKTINGHTPFEVLMIHFGDKHYAVTIVLEKNYRGEIATDADDIYVTWNRLNQKLSQ